MFIATILQDRFEWELILEWDEFTNFIIEKATVLNNIKTKQDEIKSYNTLSTTKLQFKITSVLKSDEVKSESASIQPKFFNAINKVLYIPDIDLVAFYQEGSDKIYFMNHESGILNSKELTIIPKQLSVELSSVKKEQDGTMDSLSFLSSEILIELSMEAKYFMILHMDNL